MHVALRSAALVVLVALAACEQKPTETAPTENTAAAASNADARPDTKGIKPIEGGESAPAGADLPAPADVAAPPADALKTASGLSYKVLTPGSGGDKPTAEGMVTVHYTGWTTDGKMFDSSVKRGSTANFPLNRVIAGWTEGLQLMTKGEKTRFWIPVELAYKNMPGKPAGMLVFDVELVDFQNPPVAPADVAKAPADAQKTKSGLAYKVLTPGTGTVKPTAESRVKVHYSGWTTDGKMFDSSVLRGKPAMFPLNRVIPGWTEGVQLMVVGEKTRFWIPKELAYNDQPGAPAGTLVFEIELIEIADAAGAGAPGAGAHGAGAPKASPH